MVGALLASRNLPEDRPSGRTRLDVVGLLLLSPGVAAVIFALSRLEAAGGTSRQVLIPLLAGLAAIAAFVCWARRRAEKALVDVRLFRHRPLASSSLLGFLTGAALFGALLLLPLYRQELRGESALDAGLLLIPQGVETLLSRGVAGKLTDRVGPRSVALAGFAVVTAATIPFGFVTAHTDNVVLMAALLLRGVGMGAATIPLASAAYIGLPGPDVPSASIITRVVQQLGGSMGTAVLAVILQAAASNSSDAAQAFRQAFRWSVGFAALAVPLCLLLPGRPAAEPRAPEPRSPAIDDEALVPSLVGRSPNPAAKPTCASSPP